MRVKIHHSYRDVIAICDSNLIGKRFEEGIMQVEIKEHFFDGERLRLDSLQDNVTEDEITLSDVTTNDVSKSPIRI